MVVSTDLLDCALFERSCDALNAMSSALSTFYLPRGFCILNRQVREGALSYGCILMPFVHRERGS